MLRSIFESRNLKIRHFLHVFRNRHLLIRHLFSLFFLLKPQKSSESCGCKMCFRQFIAMRGAWSYYYSFPVKSIVFSVTRLFNIRNISYLCDLSVGHFPFKEKNEIECHKFSVISFYVVHVNRPITGDQNCKHILRKGCISSQTCPNRTPDSPARLTDTCHSVTKKCTKSYRIRPVVRFETRKHIWTVQRQFCKNAVPPVYKSSLQLEICSWMNCIPAGLYTDM